MTFWFCEDCGWRWPLKGRPSETAECGACGGMMVPTDEDEIRLLRSYKGGPRIWNATAILPLVHELASLGLIEPTGDSGAYQLTDAGRARLEAEGRA